MATPPVCEFGWKAPAFSLPATDGKTYALSDIAGPNGTLIMFICNHCPYVTGAIDRIVTDAEAIAEHGVGIAAICSNDAASYPADGFDRMVEFASQNAFPFPYLHDETQEVARNYDAVCTPDFFGFDKDLGLQYRGRLDSGGPRVVPDARRELREAMAGIAATGQGPRDQTASMGCSIKWKAA
jgi:peroxiredoxin